MARPKVNPADKKVITSMTLHPDELTALRRETRRLAMKYDRSVTVSELVRSMTRKYIMKEKR